MLFAFLYACCERRMEHASAVAELLCSHWLRAVVETAAQETKKYLVITIAYRKTVSSNIEIFVWLCNHYRYCVNDVGNVYWFVRFITLCSSTSKWSVYFTCISHWVLLVSIQALLDSETSIPLVLFCLQCVSCQDPTPNQYIVSAADRQRPVSGGQPKVLLDFTRW